MAHLHSWRTSFLGTRVQAALMARFADTGSFQMMKILHASFRELAPSESSMRPTLTSRRSSSKALREANDLEGDEDYKLMSDRRT